MRLQYHHFQYHDNNLPVAVERLELSLEDLLDDQLVVETKVHYDHLA